MRCLCWAATPGWTYHPAKPLANQLSRPARQPPRQRKHTTQNALPVLGCDSWLDLPPSKTPGKPAKQTSTAATMPG